MKTWNQKGLRCLITFAALALSPALAMSSESPAETFLACSSEYEIINRNDIITVAGPGLIAELKETHRGELFAGGYAKGTEWGPGYFAAYDGKSGLATIMVTTKEHQQVFTNAHISTEKEALLSFGLTPVKERKEIRTIRIRCGLKIAGV